MGFEVIYGKVSDNIKQSNLVESVQKYFEESGDDGTLYLGYSLNPNIEESIQMADAILIGQNCGVVAFDFPEQKDLQKIYKSQDKLLGDIDFYFRMFPSLRTRRGLFFEFRVVSIVPAIDFEFDEKTYRKAA